MTSAAVIRQQIRLKRKQLPHAYRKHRCILLTKHLINQSFYRNAQHIGFYLAANGEIDTKPLLQLAWTTNKTCYLPVIHPIKPGQLLFAAFHPQDRLAANRFGILEPLLTRRQLISPWALQLVFVPLVAFDAQGNRMGMGKGYYDRTFAFTKTAGHRPKPKLVGLAYEFQKMKQLATNPWDIPVHAVATEEKIYNCRLPML